MMRFLSLLLILIGGAALAYGGYQYMQSANDLAVKSASPPAGSLGFDSGSEPMARGSTPTSRSIKPAAPDDLFDVAAASTDEFLGSLRTVPIAHETPKRAMFGRPFTVTVSLDATGDDSAVESLPGTGNIVEGEAQISSTVRALVTGEAFSVQDITPETQRISPLTENVWRWKVTPNAIGNQELVIELYALMENNEALPLRTFRDSVEVEVSRVGQAVAIAQSISPITVVAGGIGSMLAGLFGFVGFFRRR